jgi:hypothetical protein
VQDNISIIVSQNGFAFRPDDFSDDIHNKPTVIKTGSINIKGLINKSSDKDVFTLTLFQNSNFHLDANPFSVKANNEGADLDIQLSLYDASKNLIQTYNPANTMSASIDTLLNAGEYYLEIAGTGNNNASDYSSLGSYIITGAAKELPVCSVQLTGSIDKNKHKLNWSLTCYQTLKNISIQSSSDGINFADISTVESRQFNFTNTAYPSTDLYYRLKITSISESVVYSNIVLLKKVNGPANRFTISSFVTAELTVNAFENFQYSLVDINGNSIKKGSGRAGANKIDMSGETSGIYILQMAGNSGKQTEKVIKQ